jgi:hypothetical protein
MLQKAVLGAATINQREYLAAQALYLSLLGDQDPNADQPLASPLLVQFERLLSAYRAQQSLDPRATVVAMQKLDSIFNPCNKNTVASSGFPFNSEVDSWKNTNFTCNETTKRVKPGSSSIRYAEVRNLIVAELSTQHIFTLDQLQNRFTPNQHVLFNLATSAVSWSEVSADDQKFGSLASYLSGKPSQYPYSASMVGRVSPSLATPSAALLSESEAGFGLTSCGEAAARCKVNSNKAAAAPSGKEATASHSPNSPTSTNATAMTKFTNQIKENKDVFTEILDFTSEIANGVNQAQYDALTAEPRAAYAELIKGGKLNLKNPWTNDGKFKFSGWVGEDEYKAARLTDKSGNVSFVDESGNVENWIKTTHGDGASIWQIPGTRRIQKPSIDNSFGILGADGETTTWLPTKKSEHGTAWVDWTNDEAKTKFLSTVTEAKKTYFSEAIKSDSAFEEAGVKDDQIDALFYAYEYGVNQTNLQEKLGDEDLPRKVKESLEEYKEIFKDITPSAREANSSSDTGNTNTTSLVERLNELDESEYKEKISKFVNDSTYERDRKELFGDEEEIASDGVDAALSKINDNVSVDRVTADSSSAPEPPPARSDSGDDDESATQDITIQTDQGRQTAAAGEEDAKEAANIAKIRDFDAAYRKPNTAPAELESSEETGGSFPEDTGPILPPAPAPADISDERSTEDSK